MSDTMTFNPFLLQVVKEYPEGKMSKCVVATGGELHQNVAAARTLSNPMGLLHRHICSLEPGQSLECKGPIPKLKYTANMKKSIGMVRLLSQHLHPHVCRAHLINLYWPALQSNASAKRMHARVGQLHDRGPRSAGACAQVAGGSGITPMLQVVQEVLRHPEDETKVSLIFANVSDKDILLKQTLDGLAANHKNFKARKAHA